MVASTTTPALARMTDVSLKDAGVKRVAAAGEVSADGVMGLLLVALPWVPERLSKAVVLRATKISTMLLVAARVN